MFAPHNAIDAGSQIRAIDEVALETMIYYVTKKERFVGLFEKETYTNRKKLFQELANLLKQYVDQVIPYFENFKFRQYQSDLVAVQKDYNDLVIEKYITGGKVSRF